MELKTYFAQDRSGNVVPNATVAVYLAGTNTLANGLLDVNGTSISNPFTSDSEGKIQFKIPVGMYDMQISYGSQVGAKITISAMDYQEAIVLTSELTPVLEKTSFKSAASLNDQFDRVWTDSQNNILATYKDGVFDFYALSVNGVNVNAEGTLDTDDKKNIEQLSGNADFSTGAGSLNPVAFLVLDKDKNILFDSIAYDENAVRWDIAYEHSQQPTEVNPYAPFSQIDASGYSQIRVFNTKDNIEFAITSGTSNETNPRPDVLDRIVWTSDRADNAPGGLFYAEAPDFNVYPYIAKSKLVGWGDSFMENVQFMNKLATLTGLYGYNFGKSSQQSVGVAAKQGGAPAYYTPVGGSIPESGSVNLAPALPGPLAAFGNASMQSIAVTYAGVPGMFGWDGTNATFTRDASGSAVSITQPTAIDVIPTTTQQVAEGAPAGTVYYQNDECINLIWMGRNNISQTDIILSNYRSMVKYLKPVGKRFVILPAFPGSGENTGTTNNNNVKYLNAALKAEFPEFYCQINGVDLLQNFMNHYNPAYAGDVEDIANGVTPRSLRYDWLHPSQSISNSLAPESAIAAGADVNAEFVYQFMKNKGWVL